MTVAELVGILGVVVLLVGYFLLQAGKLSATGIAYSLYNLVGALLILFSLLFDWNLPAALIEIAWALVSLWGIVRILLKRRQKAN